MSRQFAKLQKIIHDGEVTYDKQYDFLYLLQNAILMALREQGRLNLMQYRHAEGALMQERQKRAFNCLEKEENR